MRGESWPGKEDEARRVGRGAAGTGPVSVRPEEQRTLERKSQARTSRAQQLGGNGRDSKDQRRPSWFLEVPPSESLLGNKEALAPRTLRFGEDHRVRVRRQQHSALPRDSLGLVRAFCPRPWDCPS